MELLAANDPERFVWFGPGFARIHAKKKGGKMYSARQVAYAFSTAKVLGIAQPVQRQRHGIVRQGFIVVDHDTATVKEGSRCIFGTELLQRAVTILAPKSAGELIESAAESACPIADKARHECSVGPPSLIRKPVSYAQDSGLPLECSDTNGSRRTQSAELTQLSRALLTNAGARSTNMTLTAGTGRNVLPTIAERFQSIGSSPEEIIRDLSDGEFKLEFLRSYHHLTQLCETCLRSITEYRDRPYQGRVSCAALMGRAMELLMSEHGQKAPRGWVRVMRTLRQNPDKGDGGSTGVREQRDIDPRFHVEPEDVLTGMASAISSIDREATKALDAIPEVKKKFVDLARIRGVPSNWTEGFLFMDGLVADYQAAPDAVIELREKLKVKAKL